jgi:hypothetical protein
VLAHLERAFRRHGHLVALDDAVVLCARIPIRELPGWMSDALAERSRKDILGVRKGRSAGRRRSDFTRNHKWFDAVQQRVDAGMLLKAALPAALQELRAQGEHVGKHNLEHFYKEHRKLVRRVTVEGLGLCWVPRSTVYIPGASAGIPPRKK